MGEQIFLSLLFIGILLIALIFFGVHRYRNYVNPLFIFSVFDIGIFTILSAFVADHFAYNELSNISQVLYLTLVYISGFIFVFIPSKFILPKLFFDSIVSFINSNNLIRFSWFNQFLLIIVGLISFALLIFFSGAGLLWLSEPRAAYQSFRSGVGFLYIIVQWSFLSALLYYIWNARPKLKGLILSFIIYSFFIYFTGSKANLLYGLILVGVYYNYFVRRVNVLLIFLSPIIFLVAFLSLLILQGSYSDILMSFEYFKDYSETTALFLSRFDEFGFYWGRASLSELWFYIPRSFYSDKPFEYGIILIHKVLFPEAAELGHTPGILPWALSYLDFGVVGVFISGFFTALIRRGAYDSFLGNSHNLLSFVLMIQLSLFSVFAFATFPLILFIGIILSLFFRYKIVFY